MSDATKKTGEEAKGELAKKVGQGASGPLKSSAPKPGAEGGSKKG